MVPGAGTLREASAITVRLGCHVSVAKGFTKAAEKAPTLGAHIFQFFNTNPRSLREQKPPNPDDTARGREACEAKDLLAVGHAPYLINLSAEEEELRAVSVRGLLQDMRFAALRGAFGVVVHCGKHVGAGTEVGLSRMRNSLVQVLAEAPKQVCLLLENTAGQGSELGTTLDELLYFADLAQPDRLGFCFDTCHAFAAGQLSEANPEACTWFADAAYMQRLRLVHLNDSKGPFGCRRDRHEKIGQGFLGSDLIGRVLRHPAVQHVPFVLETPVDDESEYGPEIARCQELAALE